MLQNDMYSMIPFFILKHTYPEGKAYKNIYLIPLLMIISGHSDSRFFFCLFIFLYFLTFPQFTLATFRIISHF